MMHKNNIITNESPENVHVTDPEQLVKAMEKTSALFDRSIY